MSMFKITALTARANAFRSSSVAVRGLSFKAADQPRIRINSVAPNFTAQTTAGKIDFHQFIGDKWTILFSHPADFTPVCTTELGAFAKMQSAFESRNCQLIGLSADKLGSHEEWAKDIEETQQLNGKFSFPIIADENREVAFLYDMVDEEGFKNIDSTAMTIRNVFIIDPAKKVRLFFVYPAAVGRNTAEVLRVLDALQLADKKNIATPVNWTPGSDVILPLNVSIEEGEQKYGSVRVLKPYLRYVNADKPGSESEDKEKSALAATGKASLLLVAGLASGLFIAQDTDESMIGELRAAFEKLQRGQQLTDEDIARLGSAEQWESLLKRLEVDASNGVLPEPHS